ncbi:hypothetical protein OIO90_000034 [Microbotryomycetes sp. JL221]|nr:hypothetical protein OIO90_000034 [Microbotryomycetes sp. JL221]
MDSGARWHKVRLQRRQHAHAGTTTTRRPAATTRAAPVADDDERDEAVVGNDDQDDAAAQTSVGRTGAAYVPTQTGRAATRIAPTVPPTRHRTHAQVDQTSYASVFAGLNSNYKPGTHNVNAATGADDVQSTIKSTSVGATKQLTASGAAASKQPSGVSSTTTTAGLTKTALIGIIAGAGAAVVLLLLLVGCCCWRKRKSKTTKHMKNQGSSLGEWQPLNASQNSNATDAVGMRQLGHQANDSKWSQEFKEMSSLQDHDAAYGGYDETPLKYNDPYADPQQRWAPPSRFQQPSNHQQWHSQHSLAQQSPSSPEEDLPMTRSPPVRNLTAQIGEPLNVLAATGALSPSQIYGNVPEIRIDSEPLGNVTRSETVDQFQDAATDRVEPTREPIPHSNPLADEDVYMIGDDEDEAANRIGDFAMSALSRTNSERTVSRQSLPLAPATKPQAAAAASAPSYPPQSRSAFANQAIPRDPPLMHLSRVDSKPLRELEDILDSFQTGAGKGAAGSVRSNSVRSAQSVAPLYINRKNGHSNAMSNGSLSTYLNHIRDESQPSTPPAADRGPFEFATSPTSTRSQLGQEASVDHSTPARPSRLANIAELDSQIVNKQQSVNDASHSPTSSISSSVPSLSNSPLATPTTPVDSPFYQHDVLSKARIGDSPNTSPSATTKTLGRHSIKRKPAPPAVYVVTVDDVDDRQTEVINTRTSLAVKAAHGFEPLSSYSVNDASYRSATMSMYGLYDDDDIAELKGLPLNDPRVSRHLSSRAIGVLA